MTIAFVLGNGVSRKGIDPEELKKHGTVYGCNALYREFVPDALVATDRPIATRIQESGYSRHNKFYTRKPMPGTGALEVPNQKYYGYSSGPLAVSIAAHDRHHLIYLLGFDLGPNSNKLFNNVYADTEFYKTSDSVPTYTGNWIKQLKTIVTDYPAIRFVRLVGETTATISELQNYANLEHLDLSTLCNQLKIQKR